jgi:hypothetical protein
MNKEKIVKRVMAKLIKAVKSPDPKLTDEQYKQIVEDNFVSAIEGGSNYWYVIEEGRWNAGKHIWDGTMTISNKKIVEDEHKSKIIEKKIDAHSIAKGWEVFKKSHQRHYKDAIAENGDATTGDVLLQCIVLGKVIYG